MQPLVFLVTASPLCGRAHLSAQRLLAAAIQAGLKVEAVFFYAAATAVATPQRESRGEPYDLSLAWARLSRKHAVPLLLCATAAARRGITTDAGSAPSDTRAPVHLADGFKLGSITDLTLYLCHDIRLLEFG